jgi:ABC-type phosphate/phosphonate transport system permease subunit
MMLLLIVCVMLIDAGSEQLRHRLISMERQA